MRILKTKIISEESDCRFHLACDLTIKEKLRDCYYKSFLLFVRFFEKATIFIKKIQNIIFKFYSK